MQGGRGGGSLRTLACLSFSAQGLLAGQKSLAACLGHAWPHLCQNLPNRSPDCRPSPETDQAVARGWVVLCKLMGQSRAVPCEMQ